MVYRALLSRKCSLAKAISPSRSFETVFVNYFRWYTFRNAACFSSIHDNLLLNELAKKFVLQHDSLQISKLYRFFLLPFPLFIGGIKRWIKYSGVWLFLSSHYEQGPTRNSKTCEVKWSLPRLGGCAAGSTVKWSMRAVTETGTGACTMMKLTVLQKMR